MNDTKSILLLLSIQRRVASLSITTHNGSARANITVTPIAPALFLTGDGSEVVATHEAGTLVTVKAPAQAMEFIKLFATGLVSIEGDVLEGALATRAAPVRARAPRSSHDRRCAFRSRRDAQFTNRGTL